MHHGDRHREHGRTRGAAATSSEPGARGISAVDHAWYVTCFDCSSMTDERLARAEFREEVAGLPS